MSSTHDNDTHQRRLVINAGDAHLYVNHLEAVAEQLETTEPSRRALCELACEWLESQGTVAIVRCRPSDAAAESERGCP